MPNHVHGILDVGRRGTPWRAPTEAFGRPVRGSLPTVIRAFKASATKILIRAKSEKEPLWQRGYYEHVVRDEEELNRLRQYIAENPLKWDEDVDNPVPR
jgi:REP element-mobilizing transposase RayT